jgi:copper chaperone CopZ
MRKVATLGLMFVLGIAFTLMPSVASSCGKTGAKLGYKANSCGAKVETAKADNSAKANDGLVLATFNVQGMTCSGCEMQVGDKLKKCEGVFEVVEVSHKDNTVVVKYDPAKTQADKLASTITDLGYKAEIRPAVAKTTKAVVDDNEMKGAKDM